MEEQLLRLGGSLLAGAVIGFERELHDKPAGLRTMILISLGACAFTLISTSFHEDGDPSRIAAQIVSGVGFLGAGAILQSKGAVIGLTTAASIWMVSSVGMAFGAGDFALGAAATLLAALVLFGLAVVERWIETIRHTAGFELGVDPSPELLGEIEAAILSAKLRRLQWKLMKRGELYLVKMTLRGSPRRMDLLQRAWLVDPRIRSLRRLSH